MNYLVKVMEKIVVNPSIDRQFHLTISEITKHVHAPPEVEPPRFY